MIQLTNRILINLAIVVLGMFVALGLAVTVFFVAGMVEYQYFDKFPLWQPELWSTSRKSAAVIVYAVSYVLVWFLFVIPTLEDDTHERVLPR